jgi:NAD+ synthase (glutamine-hydrolysing)
MAGNAVKYKLPLIYVNQVGAHSDLIFDGGSAVFNAAGELMEHMPPFREGMMMADTDYLHSEPGHLVSPNVGHDEKYSLMQEALSFGIADYFAKTGLKKAIIGLSGGIDSALTLVLATMALGPENVWAILLPGPHSSDHSVKDAETLAGADLADPHALGDAATLVHGTQDELLADADVDALAGEVVSAWLAQVRQKRATATTDQ